MSPAPDGAAPSRPRSHLICAWVLATLLALYAARGFFTGYSVYGHSADLDVARVVEYGQALRDGELFPRWVGHTYYWFGSPLFHFYAALAYLPAGLAYAIGLPVWLAIKLPFVLALLLAAWGALACGNRLAGPWAGLACAASLCCAPYFMVDAYVRAAAAEMWGIAAAPWLLWALLAARRHSGALPIALLGLLVALSVLAHNISAMLLLPILLAAALLWHGAQAWRSLIGLGLGLALSAFFWVPALLEKDLVWAEENLTQGHFEFSRHFLQVRSLIAPEWSSQPPINVGLDAFSLGLGLVGLLLLAPLCLLAVKRHGRQALLLLAVCLGSLLMVSAVSAPLWRALPLLAYVQFPWRFLGLFCWAAALLAAWPALWFEQRWGRRGAVAFGLGWSLLLALSQVGQIRPQYLALDPSTADEIVAPDLDEHLRNLERGAIDVARFWTPERMRWFLARGTSWDDFLPRVVNPLACLFCEDYLDPVLVYSGQGEVREPLLRTGFISATVKAETPLHLRLHAFAFPGWRVRVDGADVEFAPQREVGDITLDVPAGEHYVEARYVGTPLARSMNWVSLIALAGWLGLTIAGVVFSSRRSRSARPGPRAAAAPAPGARR